MVAAIIGSILGMLLCGWIGSLIGRNRKIGAETAFVLGMLLSWIGWIIAACSERTNVTKFDDVTKEDWK